MQINSIQNFNQNNLPNNISGPAFKGFKISEEYFEPMYKYGSYDANSKLKNIISDLRYGINTNLKIKTDWDNCIVGNWPQYMEGVVKSLKENWFRREMYEESIVPFIDKYSKTDKKEIQELKKKYNEMVDSLGDEGENLSIEIYPAPPHYNTQDGYMVYIIPALGLEGLIYDSQENNDAEYNDPYDTFNHPRKIYLPKESTVDRIKLKVFEKLNNIFEEGIKKGQDKIVIPKPEGKRDEEVIETLKKNKEWYEEMKKSYAIRDEECRKAEWRREFCYSSSNSWEDYFESQARETARFVHDRRFAFNEEMEDD